RGATQEDCRHSSRLRQASAGETSVRQETDRMEAVAHSELAKLSLDLKVLNAKPLWERTTRMGPGSPAVPAIWRYRDMRPQLLRAVELITAKEAERRVFMLENPGLPGSGYITNSLSLSETYALKYWVCNPPKTGIAGVRPTVWMVRGIGGSLCSDRCVRASL